jgi:hypothetical protein
MWIIIKCQGFLIIVKVSITIYSLLFIIYLITELTFAKTEASIKREKNILSIITLKIMFSRRNVLVVMNSNISKYFICAV